MASFDTSDGLSLYYEDAGSGPALLCLAGLTRNCRDFDHVAPHLAGCRVIRMDYRGRGDSAYDADFRNYSIPREARDALELLDHLGLDRAAILGTSRGGLIAMALAMTTPARLSGVILNDIGPVIEPAGLSRILDRLGRPPEARSLEDAAHALARDNAAEFPGVPLDRWREEARARYRKGPGGLVLRYDPHLRDAVAAAGADSSATDAPDPWALLDALRPLPLGVIRGANSDILSAETLRQMQLRRPDIVSTTVPDRGHVPFLDEPPALGVIHSVMDGVKARGG